MGKTYRKGYDNNFCRFPKGRKAAKINSVRNGAIPPDAWDDIPHSDENFIPGKVLRKLHRRGFSRDECFKKIKSKFKLRTDVINEMIEIEYERRLV